MTTRLDYDHEEFKRRLEADPASGGFPQGIASWPAEQRQKWLSDNTAAILADSDPLVGCDRLDENDFLTDIGKDGTIRSFLPAPKRQDEWQWALRAVRPQAQIC